MTWQAQDGQWEAEDDMAGVRRAVGAPLPIWA